MPRVCQHSTASITVYETGATVYTVEDGELDEAGEELTPDPTGEIHVQCHDCGQSWFFEQEDALPEPWQTLCHQIFHSPSL